MPELPEGLHEPPEGDLELGGGENPDAPGGGRRLERDADRIIRGGVDGDPEDAYRAAGILTPSRERTIRRHEVTASAYPSIIRAWYGEDAGSSSEEG